jgi:uncharacterized protein YjbJ (UPF0337 family)
MNWDRIEGDWKQLMGRAKQKWGQLTDDELDQARGKREELAGLVQKSYGLGKDDALREVDTWGRDLN